MPPLLRVLMLTTLIASASAFAAGLTLPPLQGSVSGTVQALAIPGAPPLQWELALDTTSPNEQTGEARLTGPGTRVTLALTLNSETGVGTWKVTDGVVELGRWGSALTAALGATGQGLKVTGTVAISGSGSIHHGQLTGDLDVALREATLASPAAGWSLEGISAGGRFAVASEPLAVRSLSPVTIGVRTIATKRFGARALTLNGFLTDRDTFKLTSARVEIAGGTLLVDPSVVSLSPFRVVVDVILNRVGLQDIAALVPSAVRSAFGRVDGTARLGWSQERGIEVGGGHLVLRNDEPAEVTLNPSPGLFTSGLPALVVKYVVPGLKRAELGQVPIAADSLDITFSPDADSLGRTATVHLTGVPKDEKRKPRIDMTTNVRGPLKPFIKLGTDTDFSLSLK